MQSGGSASSLEYRPDVDGLRAIAVLLVVGFHAFPKAITGGYIGVDVFFVISGFLITGLILHDLKRKKFGFIGFYARRIRRIFPALVIVLATCFGAGWFLLLPHELTSLGLNIFGGAAFASNLVLLGQTGYFDLSAAEKPLLHLWSLGVEEQFYIAWPFILLFAFSRKISVLLSACLLFVLSLAVNLVLVGTAAAFYLPITRAWELMMGGALAALTSEEDHLGVKSKWQQIRAFFAPRMSAPLAALASRSNVYALVGAGMIGLAALSLNKSSTFPGWLALLPTFGTVLILSSGGAWLNRTILAHPTMVLIGLISYPLYLWHWPLLSFLTIADPTGSTPALRAAAIASAVGLAWLTYRWVERPMRTGPCLSVKATCLCAAMITMAATGLAAFRLHGFPERVPSAIRDITTIPLDQVADWRLHSCLLETDDRASQFAPACLDQSRRPLLFLWGDSHGAALYPGLKQLRLSENFGLAQYTTAGCPPLLSFPVKGRPNCVENDAFVFTTLSEVKPDTVILYSAWNYGDIFPALRELIAKLRALDIPRIVIMGPPPEWDGGLPKAAYDYYMTDPLHRMLPLRSSFRISNAWYEYEQTFSARIQDMGVDYISIWDALCNGKQCQTRPSRDASQLLAFDYAHLTVPGAVYLAQVIAPCLLGESVSAASTSHFCYFPRRRLYESGGKRSSLSP